MGGTVSTVIITGVGGLVGSEAALRFGLTSPAFVGGGHTIIGIDNDMRRAYFGTSIKGRIEQLKRQLGDNFIPLDFDIRDREALNTIFAFYKSEIQLVIHAAAQPSHDYAARHPQVDFTVNAIGTLNLLEATRQYAPQAAFIFTSTNKVYGDRPNNLPMTESETRYEAGIEYRNGINEQMSIDASMHSLFGASKLAADILVQEYGRYFEMNTVCFRAGCLTGAHHAAAEQHGFLAYLAKCVLEHSPYTIHGYKGKQVRDNLHAADLVNGFEYFAQAPRQGAVYNIGGGRKNSLSVLEAISLCEELAGRKPHFVVSDKARRGDHRWWITDTSRFQKDYPNWRVQRGLEDIVAEMIQERVTA